MRKGQSQQLWVEVELNQAKLMKSRGFDYKAIAAALVAYGFEARTSNAIAAKLNPPRPKALYHAEMPRLRAEAAARHLAADRRDLTATFCGDPPPGRSALDQLRGSRG